MVKITLGNVGSLIDATTAASTINSNFTAISTAWDDNLSRDGTTPNTMLSNLDMNSFKILNLPAPLSLNEPLRVVDAATLKSGGTITIQGLPTGGTTGQVLKKNSATNFDTIWANVFDTTTPLILTNTTNITTPNPSYIPASGTLQVQGGLSVYKNFQALGGSMYLGDGTSATGFLGEVIFNLNGANASGGGGSGGGCAIDFDNANVQTMTIGNSGAVLNGVGGYDPTPMWKSNASRGWRFYSDARAVDAIKFVDAAVGSSITIFSPGSGAGVGSSLVGQITSGAGVWGIGNTSAILGTAYDATTMIYNASSVYRFFGLTAGAVISSSTGTVSVTALAAGMQTFWTTPTSANLKATVTDETGSGALVFQTSPTLNQANLVGTTTNDNAAAGSVGEIQEAYMGNNTINFTVTIATPAVVTQAGHGYTNTGTQAFVATTTGALPTGLTVGTVYWTIPGTVTSSTFQLATSVTNAFAGTAIATTGTQSGVHTGKSSVPCTTSTSATWGAIQLTSGDWDVSGYGLHDVANTTNITQMLTNFSLTSGGDFAKINVLQVTFPTTGTQNTLQMANFRVSIPTATTQIVYAQNFDTFTVSTCRALGYIAARRVR